MAEINVILERGAVVEVQVEQQSPVIHVEVIGSGPMGPQGIPGSQGPQGPKGDTGDTGAQGPKGDTGDTGPKGDKGDKGDTGSQGPKGDTGDTGPKGDTGPQGPKGDDYVLTNQDKEDIADIVIAALPTWTGGSY